MTDTAMGSAPTEFAVPVGGRLDPAAVAGVPMITRAALNLLTHLSHGSLRLSLPNGRRLRFGGAHPGPDAEMHLKDYGFAWRILTRGHLGAAEGFLRGEWETPDLTRFLQFFVANRSELDARLRGNPVMRRLERAAHLWRRNSKAGSKRNIHEHYDLGNAFYDKWLDRTMTYSSARFGDEPSKSLEEAQTAKYRSLAERIGLEPGHRGRSPQRQ